MSTATTDLCVELPLSVSEQDARESMALKLFEKGRVSCGEAAALAGMTKRAFMDLLGREGMAVFNDASIDVDSESEW